MTILIFIYGLIIGSFLNVCIYRIPLNESIVIPTSHCPICQHKLKWYDNIPLFSYIFLNGKCRYCSAKISVHYPVVEVVNSIIFLILFYYFKLSLDFIFYAIISSILIVITFIDLKEMIIPDLLVLFIFVSTILYKGINYYIGISPNLFNSFGGLFLAGGIFLTIVILSKGGMGGGDVTLISTLGFILGIKYILLNIFLSFILGAIISIFLLITRFKDKKDPIPFGPFIVLGFYITILYGDRIINFYFNLFT